MEIGFAEACNAGISFGKDDLLIPKTKTELLSETEKKLNFMKTILRRVNY